MPIVRLSGVIGGVAQRAVALARSRRRWRAPSASQNAPAVALIVNSPGGSAVQSHLIFKRIRALAEEKGKRVIVAVEDVAASGGYMIAAAADEIVVDPSSIVGSIGVISAGFGFQKLIDKIGVERRVHTAGESKSMLDPFRPEREEDVARLKAIQGDVHADVHRTGAAAPAGAGVAIPIFSPAPSGSAPARSNSASPTASAISAACSASATARGSASCRSRPGRTR